MVGYSGWRRLKRTDKKALIPSMWDLLSLPKVFFLFKGKKKSLIAVNNENYSFSYAIQLIS